jgi:hypothetical protein
LLLGVYFVFALICYACEIAKPFIASLIIGALINQDAGTTYLYILVYCGVALGSRVTEIITWRLYSIVAGRDYLHLHDKIFNKIIKSNNFIKPFNMEIAEEMYNQMLIDKSKSVFKTSQFTEENAWLKVTPELMSSF